MHAIVLVVKLTFGYGGILDQPSEGMDEMKIMCVGSFTLMRMVARRDCD